MDRAPYRLMSSRSSGRRSCISMARPATSLQFIAYTRTPKSGHLSQFNVLLGDRILAAARAMGPATADVRLAASELPVDTPPKSGLAWPDELNRYAAGSAARAAGALSAHQRHGNLGGAGRAVLRDGVRGPLAVAFRSHFLFRLYQWLVRLSSHRPGLPGRRLRTSHFALHRAGGSRSDAKGYGILCRRLPR